MDLSRKTDYALRMLAALVRDPGGVVSVRTAAREGDVPYSFARSIQHDLGVAGIVENSRGATGGMRLAVDPHEVTLLDLVEAVQGPVVISGCRCQDNGGPCHNIESCPFTCVWANAERLLRAYFSRVTLYQLVAEGLSPVFEGTFELVPTEEARARCAASDAALADGGAGSADAPAGPDEAASSDGVA